MEPAGRETSSRPWTFSRYCSPMLANEGNGGGAGECGEAVVLGLDGVDNLEVDAVVAKLRCLMEGGGIGDVVGRPVGGGAVLRVKEAVVVAKH